jgi:carbon monoxide dehydrogenase subunit G
MRLSYYLDAPAALVFEHLADPEKFAMAHPLIDTIRWAAGEHYIVHETMKAGFFNWSFSYPATIASHVQRKQITMTATVLKLATVSIVFMVKETCEGAMVQEELDIKTRLPLKFLLQNIFTKHHAQLFRNLAIILEKKLVAVY